MVWPSFLRRYSSTALLPAAIIVALPLAYAPAISVADDADGSRLSPLADDTILPPSEAFARSADDRIVYAEHGFSVFNLGGPLPKNRPSYTLRFATSSVGDLDKVRRVTKQVVNQVVQVSGVNIEVAAGKVSRQVAVPGEILVVVDSEGMCGEGAAACAGPTRFDTANPALAVIDSAQIWVVPDETLEYAQRDKRSVIAHELGHALGLHHFDSKHDGEFQTLHSYEAYESGGYYRTGDKNGLRFLSPHKLKLKDGGGEFGDVDGDGRGDLVARTAMGQLFLYPGGGTRPFDTPVQIGHGWNSFTRIRVGDMNGDGKADLLGLLDSGELYLYPSRGGRTSPYSVSHKIGQGFGRFSTLNLADVDGDGDDDLITTDQYGAMRMWASSGSAADPISGPTSSQIGHGFVYSKELLFSDLNGDGRSELLMINSENSLIAYPNTGDPVRPYRAYHQIGQNWGAFKRILGGNIGGDGFGDIFALAADGDLYRYLGNGSLSSPFNASNTSKVGHGWAGFTAVS